MGVTRASAVYEPGRFAYGMGHRSSPGCSRSDKSSAVDANQNPDGSSQIDAPTSDGPRTDASTDGPAMACTGALYDGCTDNTKCMSQNCHDFPGGILKVCTQTCTAGGTPCPQQNGLAVPCIQGLCRPDMANNCTPQ